MFPETALIIISEYLSCSGISFNDNALPETSLAITSAFSKVLFAMNIFFIFFFRVEGGYIEIKDSDNKNKKINITRAHLEEDAGKSIHSDENNCTYIDLNRSGTPLLEIVSEPEMQSANEVAGFINKF